jgi:hypothetical protein
VTAQQIEFRYSNITFNLECLTKYLRVGMTIKLVVKDSKRRGLFRDLNEFGQAFFTVSLEPLAKIFRRRRAHTKYDGMRAVFSRHTSRLLLHE